MSRRAHIYATCGRRPRVASSDSVAWIPVPFTQHSERTQSKSSTKQQTKHQKFHPRYLASHVATVIASNPVLIASARARKSLANITASNSFKYLIAGAIAGIVSRTAVSPLEVVATVNMVNGGATQPLYHQLRTLFASEGIRGFFKGNAANCLKVAPTKGIQFVAFEALKRFIFHSRTNSSSAKATSTVSTSTSSTKSSGLRPLAAWERFLAGGLAGMTAASICYPLDTVKTLLTAHPERFTGVVNTFVTVVRQQGPRALYRGLSPTLVAMMPYAGLDFAIYEQLKLLYLKRHNKEANLLILLCIGAFAGAVAQTACHPLDVVRKRLQLQGMRGRPIEYKSMISATIGIVRKEGPAALYRGLQPMYISAIPSAGVSYAVYETVKKFLGVRSFQ